MDVNLVSSEASRLPLDSRLTRACLAFVRIGFGFLWLTQLTWKVPPEFGALRFFTAAAYTHPVFPPYGWVVEQVIIPNFTFFAYVTVLTEAALGAFLILGLFTRLWALIGLAQTVLIALSIINLPHEWSWAYYMMAMGHLAILATAAGRTFGLDGIFRAWFVRVPGRAGRLLGVIS